MKNIIIGPHGQTQPVTPQVLQNIQSQMPKPSEDRTQVCNVLRQAKGGYSHRRRKIQKIS